jgi:hypothetical protein
MEPRKHGVEGLFSQLHKVLILLSVGLKESGFHVVGALLKFLQGSPDLMSHIQCLTLSNSKSERQENNALQALLFESWNSI